MAVHYMTESGVQKGMADPPGLVLEVVERDHMSVGSWTWVSQNSSQFS